MLNIAPDLTAFHSFRRPRPYFDRKFCLDYGFLRIVPKTMRGQNSADKRKRREWRFRYLYPDRCCSYCGRSGVFLTRDHVVPRSAGGESSLTNLVPSCKTCNTDKKSLSLLLFLLKRRAR